MINDFRKKRNIDITIKLVEWFKKNGYNAIYIYEYDTKDIKVLNKVYDPDIILIYVKGKLQSEAIDCLEIDINVVFVEKYTCEISKNQLQNKQSKNIIVSKRNQHIENNKKDDVLLCEDENIEVLYKNILNMYK